MSAASSNREGFLKSVRQTYFREFTEAIVAAVIVAAILRIFVVSVYRVPTESMMPTLIPGDFVVAWKTSYGVPVPFTDIRIGDRLPNRGDVVIFEGPEDALYIKRVVGVPGDRIEIRNGRLSVNEVSSAIPKSAEGDWEIFEERAGESTHRVMKRVKENEADFLAPQIVPPGHVFLLGDLRSDSFDSRQWGPISAQAIIARAAFIGLSVRIAGRDDSKGVPEGFATRADLAPGELVPEGRIRGRRIFQNIE